MVGWTDGRTDRLMDGWTALARPAGQLATPLACPVFPARTSVPVFGVCDADLCAGVERRRHRPYPHPPPPLGTELTTKSQSEAGVCARRRRDTGVGLFGTSSGHAPNEKELSNLHRLSEQPNTWRRKALNGPGAVRAMRPSGGPLDPRPRRPGQAGYRPGPVWQREP